MNLYHKIVLYSKKEINQMKKCMLLLWEKLLLLFKKAKIYIEKTRKKLKIKRKLRII